MELATLAALTARPVPLSGTWAGLVATLTAPPIRTAEKASVSLWCPVRLRDGATSRGARDVTHVTAAVIDVDGAPYAALGETISRLASLGLSAVVHTSHGAASAYPTHTKFRVVVQLVEPVPAAGWRDTWTRIVAHLTPGRADPHCRDVSRAYYVPSCPPPECCPAGWSPVAVALPGKALDPSTLPPVPKGAVGGGLPPASRRATLDDLRDVRKTWAKAKDLPTRHLARALALLIDGDPYAGEGERDVTTFDLVRRLVEAAPEVRPETWAPLFVPSLARMGSGAPTEALVEAKAVAARRYLEERPPAELAPKGHTIEDGIPWVVISPIGGAYYVRSEDGWHGPFSGESVDVALRRHLAHAVGLGAVTLVREGGKPGPLSRQEIALRYALPLDSHEIEIGREVTAVEIDDRRRVRLIEAAAPVRGVAERSEVVEEFLRRFTPSAQVLGDLLTWLSVLPDPNETLAALVITGPRESGKSLFARALSKLWTPSGPSSPRALLGEWNGSLLECPLVFADEALPVPRHGESVTAILREVLQARSHLIRRKYLPDVTARGCIRLVIAANDPRIMRFDTNMTPEDLSAIAERFYHFAVPEACRVWIREGGRPLTERIADELPGHVRHLAAEHPRERRHRFWIEGTGQVMDQLAIRGGSRSDVCRWIFSWLQRPTFNVKATRSSYVKDSKIYVNARHVYETWDDFLRGTHRPPLAHVTDALRILSGGWSHDGVWRIRPALLRAWIDESGWSVDLEAAVASFELGQRSIVGAS